jgi:hypothetical protein
MPDRVAKVGDVWADLLDSGKSLKRARTKLRTLLKG